MTDNEIIKAFELCFAKRGTILTCGKCPYHNFGKLCKVKRDKDALDLINRQKAEIERLKDDKNRLEKMMDNLCKELDAEKNKNF